MTIFNTKQSENVLWEMLAYSELTNGVWVFQVSPELDFHGVLVTPVDHTSLRGSPNGHFDWKVLPDPWK